MEAADGPVASVGVGKFDPRRESIVPMTRDYMAREEARLRMLESRSRAPWRLAGE
jgi:hypothetical protein